jgi:hypothetical protein
LFDHYSLSCMIVFSKSLDLSNEYFLNLSSENNTVKFVVKFFLKLISVIVPFLETPMTNNHRYPNFQELPFHNDLHLFIFFFLYEILNQLMLDSIKSLNLLFLQFNRFTSHFDPRYSHWAWFIMVKPFFFHHLFQALFS